MRFKLFVRHTVDTPTVCNLYLHSLILTYSDLQRHWFVSGFTCPPSAAKLKQQSMCRSGIHQCQSGPLHLFLLKISLGLVHFSVLHLILTLTLAVCALLGHHPSSIHGYVKADRSK